MDTIIGLEIHLQLKTESKMFCSCSSQYFEKEPNTLTCPKCLGLPGALPVPNKHALELCILMGLATNCTIAKHIKFDRKHYFYPDLPKGYQISQYDEPLCNNGTVNIKLPDGSTSTVLIERIHQEEDVAKTFHLKDGTTGADYTLVDYNKSGVPLIEVVTKPCIKSAQEAKLYATKIRQIARYLGISDADMEKGQMRCEPNISIQETGKWQMVDNKIKPIGDYKLNPKTEVKNIGSISAVEKAIEYEVKRMTDDLQAGKKLTQQTRGWNAEKGITEFQRSKESAEDYRYFREPDIPIINISDQDIANISTKLVELPDAKAERYKNDFGLQDYDIEVLTASRDIAEYFEKAFDLSGDAKSTANWITGIIFSHLNKNGIEINDVSIKPEDLAILTKSVNTKAITTNKAKEILLNCLSNDKSVDISSEIEKAQSSAVSDDGALLNMVKQALSENEKAVTDYKSGKTAVIGFLVGAVMKLSKGNADPNKVKDLLEKELGK